MLVKYERPKVSHKPFAALCSIIILFFTLVPAHARSLPTRHVPDAVSSGHSQFLNAMPESQTLPIDILLPVRDPAGLDMFLQEVNDPSSPSYRQFLTVAQFTQRFGPTEQDYDAVAQFVEANGMTVTDRSPNRLVLGVTASVESINKTFHVMMAVYERPNGKGTFFSLDREPTVELNVPLWHIGGLNNYSIPRPLYLKGALGVQSGATGSGPGGSFLGSDRRAAYYGETALTGSGQSVGLFQLDGYNTSDVQNYFTNVNQTLSVPINNVLVDGANAGSDGNDVEQVIDIIESVSMAPGLSQVRMYIGPLSGFTVGKTDTDIFNKMATDDIAKQLSCSWTWQPDDPGSPTQQGTNDYIFEEMAAQGQNLFVASGDQGSFPNSSGYYYPAEDAYITSVGGTVLTTNSAGGPWKSEVAWGTNNTSCSGGASTGGGISPDHIAIPSYQQLSGVINSSNKGSTSYRNVPDVAAEANCDNYYCANGSCGTTLGGTSLAAPTWAGYMALANQEEAANGHGSLGFINPPVYLTGVGYYYHKYLIDISSGTNGGFSAVPAYDLVTGWGSPNGCHLIDNLDSSSSCPSPAASPSPTSLRLVSQYDNPAYGTTTLSNNGPGTLGIFTVEVSGNYFSISNNACGAYLGQGQTCNVTVEFAPGGCISPQSGELYVYDDATGGEQTVSLTGTAIKCTTQPQSTQNSATK